MFVVAVVGCRDGMVGSGIRVVSLACSLASLVIL